ncbi:MAG: tetratricopeptide repeat protein [Lactobacillus sp.]|jgi:hypothetical protein|nr:tetratricopeptide repeat protein [Lactobacillus sp.]
MKKKNVSNIKDDAFLREVSEEVKGDNIKMIWKKYGLLIIICVAVILTVAVSWETIKSRKVVNSEAMIEEYTYAISLQSQGKYDQSLAIFQRMVDDGLEVYRDAAKVQISNIYFEQGKFSEAIALLQEIINDKSVNKQFHDMSVIKLVTYKLDTAPRDEIVNLLTPIATTAGSWSNIAKEMLAMLYIREGDFIQARAMYIDILNSPEADDDLRLRVKDMLSTIGSAE